MARVVRIKPQGVKDMTARKIVFATLLMVASSANAADSTSPQGNWDPYSRTAIAITGPISFTQGVLSLNGVPAFRYAATPKQGQYLLTPVAGPNPKLLNGNAVCADEQAPATLHVSQRDGLLTLAVFGAQALHQGKPADRLCGIFTYMPQNQMQASR